LLDFKKAIILLDGKQALKGKVSLRDGWGWYKYGAFNQKTHFKLLNSQHAVSRKRTYYVSVNSAKGVSYDPTTDSGENDDDIKLAVEVGSQKRYWKAMGGRGLDTIELLIAMGAGYGLLRWLEQFIYNLYGNGAK
jgi:hypothetical protein